MAHWVGPLTGSQPRSQSQGGEFKPIVGLHIGGGACFKKKNETVSFCHLKYCGQLQVT